MPEQFTEIKLSHLIKIPNIYGLGWSLFAVNYNLLNFWQISMLKLQWITFVLKDDKSKDDKRWQIKNVPNVHRQKGVTVLSLCTTMKRMKSTLIY